MKRTAGRALLLLLTVAVLASASVTAGAAETAFRYRHDPRLNPHAMADIIVDPTAVYGFSPSKDGSLSMYTEMDWSDPALVNGENARVARIAYHESIREMYAILDEMTAAGKSAEEIARVVSPKRNELRLAAYVDDPEGLAIAKARNLDKYGHEEGPLPEELFKQYGSWEVVIEKAFSVNSGMDACLGLYDDYYEVYAAAGQVGDESVTAVSREYAAAVLTDAAKRSAAGADERALEAFSDADEVDGWCRAELAAAVSAGGLRGYADGTLRPRNTIRRVEALVLLSRCLPELQGSGEAVAFSDVPLWAREDVARLSAAGLVKGYGNGLLGANDPLTAKQLRTLAERLSAA
ncbi:MAG: S-layer homology domain-containing protein [Oscillibacter sp.]|nr:S-layer homology domain-containing protein [Oscillibacter sp.]